MSVEPAAFYTIEEVAELTKISATQVVNQIEAGELPAMRFGATNRVTRVRHSDLFPNETLTKDLKSQRIKRLVIDLKRKQDLADRLCRDWGEAQMTATAALQALTDELGLQEVDAALERIAS